VTAALPVQVAIREYRAYRSEIASMGVEPAIAVDGGVEPAR
jgi:hypothetical protein